MSVLRPSRGPSAGWRSCAWIAAPAAAGVILRLWGLPRQILLFDELHAVRGALALPLGRILTTYQMPDYCIPLTALYRLLLDAGARASEMTFRLPVLACGLLLLVVGPLAVRRRLGHPAADAFAWLLALSPALVLYSRIVRPYLPVALLGFAAALACFDWLETGRRRSAAVYAALAAAAVWFHLGAAPLVLAPLAFAAGEAVVRRGTPGGGRGGDGGPRRRSVPGPASGNEVPGGGAVGSEGAGGGALGGEWPRSWAVLAATAGGLAVLLACFLVPARRSLLLLVAAKHRPMLPPLGDLLHVGRLFAGTTAGALGGALAALFWLLAAAGLAAAWRTDRRFAAYGAALVAAQLAGLLVLAPVGLRHPQILGRYLLICLPWVLLWVAVGISALARPANRPALALALAVLVPCALWLGGPLARPTFLHSSFAHHADFLLFSCEPRTVPAARVPAFYRELGQSAAGRRTTLIEFPWDSFAPMRELYAYEPFHRAAVLVATPEEALDDPRLRLRNLVAPAPEDFVASPARYLVVHRDHDRERERLEIHPCAGVPPALNLPEPEAPALHLAARQMGRRLNAEWGAPDYADEAIQVWDLDRQRRHRPPAAADDPATPP
jgi:hypothetical protein